MMGLGYRMLKLDQAPRIEQLASTSNGELWLQGHIWLDPTGLEKEPSNAGLFVETRTDLSDRRERRESKATFATKT